MECDGFRDERMDVLYGEADAATVRRVDEHHAQCSSCRDEMAALRRVRRDLAAWELPQGVEARPVPVRSRAAWLAAAAAVVAALGGGVWLSGTQMRRDPGMASVHWGASASDIERALARQEARHREEMAALRASLASLPPAEAPAPASAERRSGPDDALLRRVEEMIRQSEARQEAKVTARLAAMSESVETQRRYDLARVSAGLSYLEGKTGQDVVRTTELMGYVLQASQQK